MEAAAILINDVTGVKVDTRHVFKKMILGSSQSNVNVLRGELLTPVVIDNSPFNYALRRDPSVYIFGDAQDVAPLYGEEIFLLVAIEHPGDRYNAYLNKLEWASQLGTGASVYVTIKSSNLSVEKQARAVVHFKGQIDNIPGIQFGVEILQGQHRRANAGTTDGTFRGKRYFTCEDGCGLFVPLHMISPADDNAQPHARSSKHDEFTRREENKQVYKEDSNLPPSYAAAVGPKRDQSIHHLLPDSCVDPPSKAPSIFKKGQHVTFYDKHGSKHRGIVQWTGREHGDRKFEYPVVGIFTDKEVYMTDFERSITGMSHVMKSYPQRRALFLPEGLIEHESTPSQVGSMRSKSSSEIMSPEQIREQKKALEEIERKKAKNDRASIAALEAAGESINMTRQQEAMRKFEEAKQQSKSEISGHGVTDEELYGAPGAERQMKLRGEQGKGHIYDTVTPHTERCDEHRSLNKNPKGAMHRQRWNADDHTQGVVDAKSKYAIEQPESHDIYMNESNFLQHQHGLGQQGISHEHRELNYPCDLPGSQGQIFAAADTPVDTSLGLTKGSMIQISVSDPHNPVRYGVIKWIGTLSNVKGRIAGIELDDFMEGCTDGTYSQTNQKFFSCPHGKGLYFPLENLQPDQRYAPAIAADGNPLKYVSEEEEIAPVDLPVTQYIGDEKGIQGHQNSCYLDATLFGLFALTHDFDAMFLQKDPESRSVIGKILWKNIVNPLRKNGVVKYECVMRLREQLDQLGKMKGITQDEKDPEEFLNLMFKHTLQVEPFISIRRPFGVEKEYFVQLFLDMDEAEKSPSIADLMHKMFLEQKISFTEVPSKLLIQVPRFGKKFKTFPKVIPAKIMNVAKNVDLKNPLECYNCQEVAYKICNECTMEYGGRYAPAFCDKCIELVHKNKRRNHMPELSQEIQNLMVMAEFDLLSVICIETSHYVCFVRQEDRWIFFDSMANRVYDKYNIPKVVDCTDVLNEWVYPENGDLTRLLDTPSRELPEYVRRFTQDIYMCVYIQPDMAMYQ